MLNDSKRVTQYVNYSKERINQMRNRIRFWKQRTALDELELENQK